MHLPVLPGFRLSLLFKTRTPKTAILCGRLQQQNHSALCWINGSKCLQFVSVIYLPVDLILRMRCGCNTLGLTQFHFYHAYFCRSIGCSARIEMCGRKRGTKIYITERFRNCDSIKCSKFHLSQDEIDRSGRGRHWGRCWWKWLPRWHRWLSRDFHCWGQLGLTWQRVMRLSIELQRNKQSSTPPKSLGRRATAKCNILKNVAWEKAAHWFSIDYSIRALM